MANKGFAGEIEESFLTCSICFQPYNTPKALPCLHTFCLGCIRDYFYSRFEGADQFPCPVCRQPYNTPKALPCLHTFCLGCIRDYFYSRFEGADQFPCPVCRQTIYMPSTGVNGFPDNHFIVSLGDTIHSEGQKPGEYQRQLSQLISETFPLLETEENNRVIPYGKSGIAKLERRFGNFGTEASDLLHISGLSFSSLLDDIVVADCSLNKITIFSMRGVYRSSFLCNSSIRDVCVSRAGTILVSISRHDSAIMCEYTFEGKIVAYHGNYFKYDNPFGIAESTRGKVFVTCLQPNCIRVFTERKKTSVNFGSRGSGPNHLMLPYYIATNTSDDVIISDSGNHRVKVHKNDGTFKFQIGHQGVREGELFYPMGVCSDNYNNIYVADANNYRIQMFSSEGLFMACPVQRTFEYGSDVKPTNVIFVHNKLVVALRGHKFAEIHIYNWDPCLYQCQANSTKTDFFSFCCCCGDTSYDEL
ncbi:hypothetical protein ScPMuIL_008102 [Solemya velum]